MIILNILVIFFSILWTVSSYEHCVVQQICSTRAVIKSTTFCEYQYFETLQDTTFNIKLLSMERPEAFFRVDYRNICRNWIDSFLTVELTDNEKHCTTLRVVKHGWLTYQIQMNGLELDDNSFYIWSKIRVLFRGEIEFSTNQCEKPNNNATLPVVPLQLTKEYLSDSTDTTTDLSDLQECFIAWYWTILIGLAVILSLMIGAIAGKLMLRNKTKKFPPKTIGEIMKKLNQTGIMSESFQKLKNVDVV